MVKRLGRWRATDTPPIGARPGAFLASPVDDLARRVAARAAPPARTSPIIDETHIYIHDAPRRPVRTRTNDAPSRQPAVRHPGGRDQLEQPKLLCKLGQDGSTGDWTAEDGEGNPLRVEHGTGGLEIYSVPRAEGDQGGGENLAGGPPPGATALDRLRARIGPRQNVGDRVQQQAQMEATQAYLNELHRPRS